MTSEGTKPLWITYVRSALITILHKTPKTYIQQYNRIFDESCQQDSARGTNVSHLHYDDDYYSCIIDLYDDDDDDDVNQSDYVEFSNLIGELKMCVYSTITASAC
jgi:hypothetical protein